MTPSALVPLACPVLIPPPPLQAFNSLLPSLSLPLSPLTQNSKVSPCPVDTGYSRQGPKVPAEPQPAGKHKHTPPARARPGSPTTRTARSAAAATPQLLPGVFLGELCPSGLSFSSFPSAHARANGRSAVYVRAGAPGEARDPGPWSGSLSLLRRAGLPPAAGGVWRGGDFPGSPARVCVSGPGGRARACHSGREFGLPPAPSSPSESAPEWKRLDLGGPSAGRWGDGTSD